MTQTIQHPSSKVSTDVWRLPEAAKIQFAHFRVSDLGRSLQFYRDLLGLVETRTEGNITLLAAAGSNEPILRLTEDGSAKPRSRRSPGLFHLALLYPNRRDLAAAFKHLYVRRWPFQGFADHGVSEALYLADPEGNGIELYRDLPRDQWRSRNGELEMVTEPLDLDNLLSELTGTEGEDTMTSEGLSVGHIHLQVSDLHRTEEFYHDALGFDITQRSFPGALFMSAGGYHHHIGANVWNSRGSAPMQEDGLGLVEFGVTLGNAQSRQALAARMKPEADPAAEPAEMFVVSDPDNIKVSIV